MESALNIVRTDTALTPLRNTNLQPYADTQARALEPYLLAAAMALLLFDALLALWLRGFTRASCAGSEPLPCFLS